MINTHRPSFYTLKSLTQSPPEHFTLALSYPRAQAFNLFVLRWKRNVILTSRSIRIVRKMQGENIRRESIVDSFGHKTSQEIVQKFPHSWQCPWGESEAPALSLAIRRVWGKMLLVKPSFRTRGRFRER